MYHQIHTTTGGTIEMVMMKKYAQSITSAGETRYLRTNNSTDKYYRDWSNINKLKNAGGMASCNNIGTPSGTWNRPSPLTFRDFNFNLPVNAKIEKIRVHYSHNKVQYSSFAAGTAYPSIAAPTISISTPKKSVTGVAVPATYSNNYVEFTDVTAADLNNASFNVTIAYPKNTATNVGGMNLGDVYVEVIYAEAQVQLEFNATHGKTAVLGGTSETLLTVKDPNKTENKYTPIIRIKSLISVSLESYAGDGIIEEIESNDTRYHLYEWTARWNNYQSSINLTWRFRDKGSKGIVVTDTQSSATTTLTFTVQDITIKADSTIQDTTPTQTNDGYSAIITTKDNKVNITENTYTEYDINLQIPNSQDTTTQKIRIVLPATATFQNLPSGTTTTYNDGDNTQTLTMNVTFTKGYATVPMKVMFSDTGVFYQQILYTKNNKWIVIENIQIIVTPTNLGELAYTKIQATPVLIDRMETGTTYAVHSFTQRVPQDPEYTTVTDRKRNFRFGIFNSKEEYLENDEDFLNHVIYNTGIATLGLHMKLVQFKYNANNPLYFVWTIDYTGSEDFEINSLNFTEPHVYTDLNNKLTETAVELYPYPIKALLDGHESTASLDLPATTPSGVIAAYDWQFGGIDKIDGVIIQGITIDLDYNLTDDSPTTTANMGLTLGLQIKTETGEIKTGYRSVTLTEGSGHISLGGKFELFGLKTRYFRKALKTMTLLIQEVNAYNHDCTIELDNLEAHMYYTINEIDDGNGFTIIEKGENPNDGIRSEDYGFFMKEVLINAGTENEVRYFHTEGTDITTPYRLNIDVKDIEITGTILDCNIDDATLLMQKLARAFSNDRTEYNKPILKGIIFDNTPEWCYWFVREKGISYDPIVGGYEIKIKLVVPSGTAESLEEKTTGAIGSNDGVAKVTPTITAIVTENTNVSISEVISEPDQVFDISNEEIESGDTLKIDNTNRTVILIKKGTGESLDISDSVNYASTWFALEADKDFQFETYGALILEVRFNERW